MLNQTRTVSEFLTFLLKQFDCLQPLLQLVIGVSQGFHRLLIILQLALGVSQGLLDGSATRRTFKFRELSCRECFHQTQGKSRRRHIAFTHVLRHAGGTCKGEKRQWRLMKRLQIGIQEKIRMRKLDHWKR